MPTSILLRADQVIECKGAISYRFLAARRVPDKMLALADEVIE